MSLVKMCIDCALEDRSGGKLALYKQLTSKRSKEDLLCYKTVLAVSENISMHYIIMFF